MNQGPRGDCLMKKPESQKPRGTAPLKNVYCIYIFLSVTSQCIGHELLRFMSLALFLKISSHVLLTVIWAASCYGFGYGFAKIMKLLAAPAPRHWLYYTVTWSFGGNKCQKYLHLNFMGFFTCLAHRTFCSYFTQQIFFPSKSLWDFVRI
jgi:hypothetical protein